MKNKLATSIIRVSKAGCTNFWRNKWLSVAAIAMMFLTILTIVGLLMTNVLVNSFAASLEDKIDISVYFNLEASEEKILETKKDLAKLSEVRNVEYISSEEAYNRFKEKHKENSVLMQSLQEVGDNPLKPSLNIQAQSASQYNIIASFFDKDKYQEIVDKINYQENEIIINRLSSMTTTIRKFGFIFLLSLAIIAVFVTFNTIRLAIYSSRKEIKVMKLVGASNWFVRGPFIIEGALYGLIAALLVTVVLTPFLWYLSPKITSYVVEINLFQFFKQNFISLLLLQVGVGMSLGMASSFTSIRRYLDV
ncbi:MAG: permease-like cell division protein FtsX [bacterium]